MTSEAFILTGEEVHADPYHYEVCGLENIYLLNGFHVTEHDGESHVAITDIEGLHRAIGRHIVVHRKSLGPKDVRFLRNTLGVTQAELGNKLGVTSQSVARWEKGECEMPGTAEKLFRAVYLVSSLDSEELGPLRDFLTKALDELDALDQLKAPAAQFRLGEEWTEEVRLAA